jgi:hypothetical protein
MNNYSTDITDLTKLDLPKLYDLIKNLQDSIVTLLEVNKKLKEQNDELSKNVIDAMAVDILEYFNYCKSIKETAERYDMTTEEVIHWIPYWDVYVELQSAHDYKDFINN